MTGLAASSILVLGAILAAPAVPLDAQRVSLPPNVEIRIPKPPTVARGDGQRLLIYELHVTNLMSEPLMLKRIDVLGTGAAAPVATLADSALVASISRPGVSVPPADRPKIGAGLRAVVFAWVPLAEGTQPPRAIRHRLTFERGAADSVSVVTAETGEVSVSDNAPVIGPPLRGAVWLAANGPAAGSGHRRAMVPIDGALHIVQRFAIDYLKVNAEGRTFSGDSLENSSYLAYGNDALAVADGSVVAVKDGIPENIPGSRAVPITLETVGGNHVIVDIGGGRYAFYAHLQPGSIKVHVGDRVKRGQVLGLVGNSGNSTEPHLHFHISDGNSPLGSEGIPYVFSSFERVGRCRTLISGCTPAAPTVRQREMPFANQLVRFPE